MMDLSKYGFQARDCARTLDKIEARLGVKFNRQEMFDREDHIERTYRGDMVWTFKISKEGNGATFFAGSGGRTQGVKTCICGHHVEFVSSTVGYPSGNALDAALGQLKRAIPKIQALRTPKPPQETTMDLSKYNFYAKDCAKELDVIEPALGVKFDRKAMFDREQALWEQLNNPTTTYRQWVFRFSKDPSNTTASFDDRAPIDSGIVETSSGIEYAPRGMFYSKDALLCSLKCLKEKIPQIQALRKPQPRATMRQFTPSERETTTEYIKTINQNLRANLDPAAIIAAYEQTDPNSAVGIAIAIPSDFNQPATFEVKSGGDLGSLAALPLSDRLILVSSDDRPNTNLYYVTQFSTSNTQTEWLKTHRIPPSDGIDELVAELVETCSRDKVMRVKYQHNGSIVEGRIDQCAESIRKIHMLYSGKACALDLYYRAATDTPMRANLNFRLASDAPQTDCSTHATFSFTMYTNLRGVLQDLIRRIKASGQG